MARENRWECVRGLVLAAAVAAIASVTATPAHSAQPEDCPLFFPDLRCERSGRYDGFVMPMASPFLFEDPFITTGVYAYGVWHQYPKASVFQGGDAWVVAVQARLAITDRLAFIATKDGFVVHSPDNAILSDEEGFLDIAAGLKYALIDMPESNFILSQSLRIEAPTGNNQVFSGNGDGVLIPATSAAWGRGQFHLIGDLGWRVPFDTDKESTSLFYHLHADYALHERLVPFIELSGYSWITSGDGTLPVKTSLGTVPLSTAQVLLGTGSFEGADVVNLGSTGVAGNNLVTLSVGARVPIMRRVTAGAAYEFPLTHREDIFNQRVTMNLMFEL